MTANHSKEKNMETQMESKAVPLTKEQAKESFLHRLTSHGQQNQPAQPQFGGMPFRWAAGFACLCLISLFLGHYITIRGQEMINLFSQKPVQVIAPNSPAVIKVEPDAKTTQRTEQALGTIAASIDGTSQNMDRLVNAVNLKFAKVQEQIAAIGSKIESMPKESQPVDLTDIKTAIASLGTTLHDNKNVDVIVASIKENSQRQDQAFRQLTTSVAELQRVVKEKTASEELKVNSTLGEKFPPKK